MLRRVATLFAAAMLTGCATAGPARPALSSLTSQEAALVGTAKPKEDGGFRHVWKSAALGKPGLIKWDEDRSSVAPGAPRDLLQTAREEVGRLNQDVAAGSNVRMALTVQKFRLRGLFREAAALCEVAIRDDGGRLLWAARGEVEANPALGKSLADTDALLVARELARMMRVDLSRPAPR